MDYMIRLDEQSLNFIISVLGKQPWEQVTNLISHILIQKQEQENAVKEPEPEPGKANYRE